MTVTAWPGDVRAALQYISQSLRLQDPAIKDLFLDIGTEELSHMEMVAETINLLQGEDLGATRAEIGTVGPHVLGGLSPMLSEASGNPWIATYVNVTGEIAADLLSNIAAEQRAKVVYEYLCRQIEDKGVRETIDFLLNREEAHNGLFREALNRRQDQGSNRDFGVTRDSKLYSDLSTPSRYFRAPPPRPRPSRAHGARARPSQPIRAKPHRPWASEPKTGQTGRGRRIGRERREWPERAGGQAGREPVHALA